MIEAQAIRFGVSANTEDKQGQQRICHSIQFPGAAVPGMPEAIHGDTSGQATRSTAQWCQHRCPYQTNSVP